MTNYAWTLFTIGTLVSMGLIAVVALYLFGPRDQAPMTIGIVFAFLTPTLTNLLVLAKAHENTTKIDQVVEKLRGNGAGEEKD